jgi:poly-gamma-glutamate synthase PgsB/CapB
MMAVPVLLIALLLVAFATERILVHRWTRSVPLRIHVNGTRGKSSVTLYIAAALRASGRRTLAKITGVIPTIVAPDGSSSRIRRRGRPHVREQIGVIRKASSLKCDAIVVECMSINSGLQKLEGQMLRPHITILTNILDDHREELGETESERVGGFCSALPRDALIVLGDRTHGDGIERAAGSRASRVIVTRPPDAGLIEALPSGVMAANVAIALEVCRQLHLSPDICRQAILAEAARLSSADPVMHIRSEYPAITFVNGFAVNDVPSAERFLGYWTNRISGWKNLTFILNTRHDRPLRSVAFAGWCGRVSPLRRVILAGTHIPLTRRALLKSGVPRERIHVWSPAESVDPAGSLKKMMGENTLVIGFGNIAGDGFRILDGLREASVTGGTRHDH